MTVKQKKAVIFAPFWRMQNHVGNNRIDRFVRWLAEDGYTVVMVSAGRIDSELQVSWGVEITIRDVLGVYPTKALNNSTEILPRKPNKLRKTLSSWLFNPDPGIVWARAAAKHPSVLCAMTGASFILSSSPPESIHVGAWMLSRITGVPHIMDLRDGWIDEPLKHLLRNSALRRLREGRLESLVMRNAKVIQVSSDAWKELLCQRLPEHSAKVKVLTNGYPQHMPDTTKAGDSVAKDALLLIHAGRFLGSRLTQRPELLLQPLSEVVSQQNCRGIIQLFGSLSDEELAIINQFKKVFSVHGWTIDCPGSLPRHELLQRLPQADGLLLLSASYAAIPSKLFEYIPTGKPIFVVTEQGSSTWKICEDLPQACLIKINADNKISTEKEMFCINKKTFVPLIYSDTSLAQRFLSTVRTLY